MFNNDAICSTCELCLLSPLMGDSIHHCGRPLENADCCWASRTACKADQHVVVHDDGIRGYNDMSLSNTVCDQPRVADAVF